MAYEQSSRSFELKWWDRTINPRLPEFSDLWVSESANRILEEGWIQIWDGIKEAATELDIFSLVWKNNDELKRIIKQKTWIDISSIEWRRYVQLVYENSIKFYEDVLYRIPSQEVKWYDMTKESEIYKFLQSTHKSGNRRQTYCNIVKIMFLFLEQSSAQLDSLDEKSQVAINDLFVPHMICDTSWFPKDVAETFATIIYDSWDWNQRNIRFKIKFRAKTASSNVLKLWYNPEYKSAALISDAIGLEYEVEDPNDLLCIQSYFYTKIFAEKWIHTSVSDKNILELLWDNRDWIHDDFYDLLPSNNGDKGKIKKQTWITYRDLKTTVKLPVPTNPNNRDSQKILTWFEFRWVLSWNKNNSWLADHRIYNYFKRIEFMIRMQGYVTESYIKLVINKLFEENPEVKFSKDKILKHYLWALFRIHIWRKKKPLYTTEQRYQTLSQRSDLYPEWIIPG